MLCAEWVDVPSLIRAPTAFLDMRTNQVLVQAAGNRAVGWSCLSAKVLPVLQPRTTFAGGVRGAVNVADIHLFPPSSFRLAERRRQIIRLLCGEVKPPP